MTVGTRCVINKRILPLCTPTRYQKQKNDLKVIRRYKMFFLYMAYYKRNNNKLSLPRKAFPYLRIFRVKQPQSITKKNVKYFSHTHTHTHTDLSEKTDESKVKNASSLGLPLLSHLSNITLCCFQPKKQFCQQKTKKTVYRKHTG